MERKGPQSSSRNITKISPELDVLLRNSHNFQIQLHETLVNNFLPQKHK